MLDTDDILWLTSRDWRGADIAAQAKSRAKADRRTWTERPSEYELTGALVLQVARTCFDAGQPLPEFPPTVLSRRSAAGLEAALGSVLTQPVEIHGHLPPFSFFTPSGEPVTSRLAYLHWIADDHTLVEQGQLVAELWDSHSLDRLPRRLVAAESGVITRKVTTSDDLVRPDDVICTFSRPQLVGELGPDGLVKLPATAPAAQVVEHVARPGTWYGGGWWLNGGDTPVSDEYGPDEPMAGAELLLLKAGPHLLSVTNPVGGVLIDLRPIGHPVRGGDVVARIAPGPAPAEESATPDWEDWEPAKTLPPSAAPASTAAAADELIAEEMRRLRGELG